MENNEMETIRIDFDVWKELQNRRETKAMTENDALRKILGLPMATRPLPPLAVGDRVRHPAFGTGKIETRAGQAITVRFDGIPQPKHLRIPEAVQAGMEKLLHIQPPPPRPEPPRMKLRVCFADGTELHDTQSVRTFMRAIEKIGPEQVSQLRIPMSGEFLVLPQPGRRTEFWKTLSGGFYVNTNSSNATKKKQLEDIRDRLSENFTVELR